MSIEDSTTNIQLTIAPEYGYNLPPGFSWNPTIVNGKKEGKVDVFNEEGLLCAKLFYHEGKLEGECSFFEEGLIKEKVMYKNDVLNGWSRFYKNGKEDVVYLNENGNRVKKLIRDNELYREVDLNNEGNYEMGHYDENYTRDGLFYKVENNVLKEENEYKNGVFVRKTKDFVENILIEYNENGDKIYQGEYMMNSNNEYVRGGKGKEYEENKVVYVGNWYNGEKDGEGMSMKNGVAYYDGQWKKNVPDGYGKLLNEDGNVIIEGEWEKGYIEYKSGLYNFQTQTVTSVIAGIGWIWSEVIIGMIYMFGSLIVSFNGKYSNIIFNIFAIPGLFYFVCAFLHQFNDICIRALSIVAIIAYCITTILIVVNMIEDAWNEIRGIFQYFLFVLLCILYFYLPISSIFIQICQYKSQFPFQNDMFLIIDKKKGSYLISLNFLIEIVITLQELVFFWNYKYYGKFNLRWLGLFMLVNCVMYFVILYLQAHDGKLFKYGVWMGMIWGIVSCILCIIFANILGNINCSDCDDLITHFNFMSYYTWFISLSSLLLYFFNKPSKKLPIKPSSSV